MSRAPLRLAALALAASCVFLEGDTAGLGEECLFNGDCASPLVCAGRRCRAPCRDDRDCVNGWRCRGSGDGRLVCLPPDDRGYCRLAADCADPFVCSADGTCTEQCREAADCRRYSPSAPQRCLPLDLPGGERVHVCENHPRLRDGGVDASTDASTDVPADVRTDTTADAPLNDVARDAGDAAATGCPTSVAGACVPGAAGCALEGVALGSNGGCAWFSDGSLRCWARALDNQPLLHENPRVFCARPAVRFTAGDVREVAINGTTGCLRTGDGYARCWGAALLGNGGDGTTGSATPVTVERYPDDGPLAGVARVALSVGRGACAVAGPTRRVFCWGPRGTSFSADGTTAARTRAAENPALDEVDEITLGGSAACALRRGAVWCFGDESAASGFFDAGLPNTRQVPLPMAAVQVASGVHHTCAILADRTVTCWGDVWNGASHKTPGPPTPVPGLTAVEEVAGAWDGSNCARRTDGTVWCWGANWALGDGSTAERGTPAPVPGLSGIRRVWGRDRSFCASRGGADLWCWGDYRDPSGAQALRPAQVVWGAP
ncbi:MAG: hypothetical protein U0324_39845 [Polyangiales bacterium]